MLKYEAMPIIKSAIKKLRADKRKEAFNKTVKSKAVGLLKEFRKEVSEKGLPALFSALDKASKSRVFHPRKADRLKSRLAKLLAKSKKK